MKHRALQMLGLCARAGKADSGEFAVEQAVRRGRARLVILSEDASANTKKKFQNMCAYHQVPCRILAGKEELGRSIGRELRAVVSVNDSGLAEAVIRKLDEE